MSLGVASLYLHGLAHGDFDVALALRKIVVRKDVTVIRGRSDCRDAIRTGAGLIR